MPQFAQVTRVKLIEEAKRLRSKAEENPEYDRALIELITLACGGGVDDIPRTTYDICKKPRPELWFTEPTIRRTVSMDDWLIWHAAEDELAAVAHVQVEVKDAPEIRDVGNGIYNVGAWVTVTESQLDSAREWQKQKERQP
jgi:hypothetical protein